MTTIKMYTEDEVKTKVNEAIAKERQRISALIKDAGTRHAGFHPDVEKVVRKILEKLGTS